MNSDKKIEEEQAIKPIAIILPAYNVRNCLNLTIDSLLNSTDYPLKLLIIESESTDGTAERCEEYAKNDKRIKVIYTKKEGPTKAVNVGIKEAGDLDVFLTQTDVIFPRKYGADWLAEMVKVSQMQEDCGVVTTLSGWGISGPIYLDKFKYIGTWSMFLPRKTINKIGLFDEENFSEHDNGLGDDIDYSYRIYLAGLQTYLINYWVDHHRMIDIHIGEDMSDTFKHAKLFRKKFKLDEPSNLIKFCVGGITRTFEKSTLLDVGYREKDLNGIIKDDLEVFDKITNVLKTFNDDDIYIDVGACVGDTAMWITKGTCFTLEPSDRSYKELIVNCNLNKESKVVPLKLAAYNKVIHYKIVEGLHFGLDEIEDSDLDLDYNDPKTITLDETFINIPNIRLIKIDCEGTDKEVLEGAIEIIKKNKPIIIIEINHSDQEAINKILSNLNYDLSESRGITCIGVPK